MKTGASHCLPRPSVSESGFTLAASVFLLSILALLSAYLVNLRLYQESGIVLDTTATRAYAAARSGTEWGAYNSARNNLCAAAAVVPLAGTLAGYTVTVRCSRSTHDEGGASVSVDTIVANACNQPAAGNCPNPAPGVNYVEREIAIAVAQ